MREDAKLHKIERGVKVLDDNIWKKITYRCGYRGCGTYPLNSSQNIEGYDICVILGYGPSDVKNGKKSVLFENPQARVNIVKNEDPIKNVRFRP